MHLIIEILNINDAMKNKGMKPTNRKVWRIPPGEQAEWIRESIFLRQTIDRPQHPRFKNIVRSNGFIDGQDTIEIDDPESFHCAIGLTLCVAQYFGLLPVIGVRASSPEKLVFKKLSFRTIYALSIMIMILTMASISIVHMIQTLKPGSFGVSGGIAAATAGAIFYGNTALGTALFIWLAPRWPCLQRQWRAMERVLDRTKHRPPHLRWKFSIITAVVMILSLVEHIISIVNNIPHEFWSTSKNFQDFLQSYCEKSHGFIFSICQYNLAMGIFIFCSSNIGTFTWNFTDLFVILVLTIVSTGLAERYKSLNARVSETTVPNRSEIDWHELRESYATLSMLVKEVDNHISPIMLLSFGNNLYFICLQLLNGLSPGKSTTLGDIYFYGSFAFLVGRTIAVTLFASRINDQSKLALPALYICPGADYDTETQRLLLQITTDEISLTGMRFFHITRNFMLAVSGAIITYEVVLLQFNVAIKQ